MKNRNSIAKEIARELRSGNRTKKNVIENFAIHDIRTKNRRNTGYGKWQDYYMIDGDARYFGRCAMHRTTACPHIQRAAKKPSRFNPSAVLLILDNFEWGHLLLMRPTLCKTCFKDVL